MSTVFFFLKCPWSRQWFGLTQVCCSLTRPLTSLWEEAGAELPQSHRWLNPKCLPQSRGLGPQLTLKSVKMLEMNYEMYSELFWTAALKHSESSLLSQRGVRLMIHMENRAYFGHSLLESNHRVGLSCKHEMREWLYEIQNLPTPGQSLSEVAMFVWMWELESYKNCWMHPQQSDEQSGGSTMAPESQCMCEVLIMSNLQRLGQWEMVFKIICADGILNLSCWYMRYLPWSMSDHCSEWIRTECTRSKDFICFGTWSMIKYERARKSKCLVHTMVFGPDKTYPFRNDQSMR